MKPRKFLIFKKLFLRRVQVSYKLFLIKKSVHPFATLFCKNNFGRISRLKTLEILASEFMAKGKIKEPRHSLCILYSPSSLKLRT